VAFFFFFFFFFLSSGSASGVADGSAASVLAVEADGQAAFGAVLREAAGWSAAPGAVRWLAEGVVRGPRACATCTTVTPGCVYIEIHLGCGFIFFVFDNILPHSPNKKTLNFKIADEEPAFAALSGEYDSITAAVGRIGRLREAVSAVRARAAELHTAAVRL
jgi:hypothetical protein